MPKKASAKGAKKSDKEKKPTRPTRCDESFRWTPRPPLVEAAATNNTARIKTLLARGEKPEDALHYAIGRGKLEVVNILLANGVDLHTDIKEGDYWVPPPRPPTPPPKAKKGKKGGKKKKK